MIGTYMLDLEGVEGIVEEIIQFADMPTTPYKVIETNSQKFKIQKFENELPLCFRSGCGIVIFIAWIFNGLTPLFLLILQTRHTEKRVIRLGLDIHIWSFHVRSLERLLFGRGFFSVTTVSTGKSGIHSTNLSAFTSLVGVALDIYIFFSVSRCL